VLCNVLCVGVERIFFLILDAKDFSDLVHENEQNSDLKQCLTEDVSPHNTVNDHIRLLCRLAVKDGWRRRLSSEGEGSEGIHNQVNPEKLHGGQRLLTEEASASEDEEHGNNVDSELELEELADIVIDVTTESNGSQNRAEVVIHKLDITSVLGNIGASDSHSETNIRSVESRRVVGTISSHSDSLSDLDQTINEHKLVVWLRSGHNLELGVDLAEDIHVTDLANNLFDLLGFFGAVIIVDFFILLFKFNFATNSFSELLSSHANILSIFSIFI